MDFMTILLAVLGVIILVTLIRFVMHSLKTVFYVLLVALVLVYFFGISFQDVFDTVVQMILWVL